MFAGPAKCLVGQRRVEFPTMKVMLNVLVRFAQLGQAQRQPPRPPFLLFQVWCPFGLALPGLMLVTDRRWQPGEL